MKKAGVRILLGGAETSSRLQLRRILSANSDIEVASHVRPGMSVEEALRRWNVDVFLLDIGDDLEGGRSAAKAAESLKTPVILLTHRQDFATALRGTGSVLMRPEDMHGETATSAFGISLNRKILSLAQASGAVPKPAPPIVMQKSAVLVRPELIAIGSSTGGPQALPEVLAGLSGRIKQPIVITQHMPAAFTHMLAAHLSRYTQKPTVEATEGMPLCPGHVYLAPGGKHLLISRQGKQMICHLDEGPPEHFCRPAVDPMIRSITETVGGRALAVILTGMGSDGLAGCRNLVKAGGTVLAQNEATSIVWGMPGAVAQAGLCRSVLPLNRIADEIVLLAGMQI